MTTPDPASAPPPGDAASPAAPTPTGSTDPAPPRAGQRPLCVVLFVCLVVGLLAADLLIKYWSFAFVAGAPVVLNAQDPLDTYIPPHDPIALVPGVLSLHLTTNTGAVFGLGKGARWLFVLVSIVATGVILAIFLRSSVRAWPLHLALGLMLGGALGNLYDRVRYAAVRDMFWLFEGAKLPFGLRWPGGTNDIYPWLFNLADAALVAGVLMLMVLMWLDDRRAPAKPAGPG